MLALAVVTVKDTLVGILVGVVAGGVTVWLLPRVIAPLHLSLSLIHISEPTRPY